LKKRLKIGIAGVGPILLKYDTRGILIKSSRRCVPWKKKARPRRWESKSWVGGKCWSKTNKKYWERKKPTESQVPGVAQPVA